jgi:hypothetical protein
LCADQVRYLWPIADLKQTYSLLRNAIGLGHALMQPQMFEPGVREEGILVNYSEPGCRLATVCVGRRVAAFNHQLRINAEAVLMLSTLLRVEAARGRNIFHR